MKRIKITHTTEYLYSSPVNFGPHLALVRPREGHDLHIESSLLTIEPKADVRWFRDIYGNSVAVINFHEPGQKLSIFSEVDVDIYEEPAVECAVDPYAQMYPFQYPPNEQIDIVPYRLPSYPQDGIAMHDWLRNVYVPGQSINTSEVLNHLNSQIFESFQYVRREEAGVQLPCQTLSLGSGSCRDFAVLMMEVARQLGFAARFVTGYIQLPEGEHGATHAWTEIYIPGAGWRGFDPTNNKIVGSEHVSVAVSREQENASPLSGSWSGPTDAFQRMNVSVQVTGL